MQYVDGEWTLLSNEQDIPKAEAFVSQDDSVPEAIGEPEEVRPSWPKDEWRRGPNCWIRIHRRPRRALFMPTGTKNGPDLSTLSGLRSTKVDYASNDGEIIDDCWLHWKDRALNRKWTGSTYFYLIGSPQPFADRSQLDQPTPAGAQF